MKKCITQKRKEMVILAKKKKLTRHNGRSNQDGVFQPEHNDRRFDLETADHIDPARTPYNIYWNCYQGISCQSFRDNPQEEYRGFEEVEMQFYREQYNDYLFGQHERNAKRRHSERDRTSEQLRLDKRTCPEETIYQIGTREDHEGPDVLIPVVMEFFEEMERRYGKHIHTLDWALHLDEDTPHIHERHVFDYCNKYGEIEPAQEKALEALGFELPHPEKKVSKHNNRKIAFDAECRRLLFDICKKHGLDLEEEPEYGGRAYLQKQDYILMKQKEEIAEKTMELEQVEEELQTKMLRLDDMDTLLDEFADVAYDKAVDVVTDAVRSETQNADIRMVDAVQKTEIAKCADNSAKQKLINRIMTNLKQKMLGAASAITKRITDVLRDPEVKQNGKEEIKKAIKPSVMDMLARARNQADAYNSSRKSNQEQRYRGPEL
ncbi:plasmid recombination protein [Faecalicatena contorta]|uniref:plasmid recombination protein n=1 Tax=Faecalicatena contorta TaxID=39482 RepID=UPI001FADE78C|nr:plasmid recombination protein [Faecalicatena contorta]